MVIKSLAARTVALLAEGVDRNRKIPRRVSGYISRPPRGGRGDVYKRQVLVPRAFQMPAKVKKSSNVAANFLCDNSSYMLGVDNKENPSRTVQCFAAAKDLHLRLLSQVSSPAAQAIVRYFETWDPTCLLYTSRCVEETGRWQSVIWYFDEHGEKKRKVFSSKTKIEAQQKITNYIVQFNEEVHNSDESQKTLKDSLTHWLQVFKFPSVERTTYDRLECTAQHQVFPLIGEKIVGDITAADLKSCLLYTSRCV